MGKVCLLILLVFYFLQFKHITSSRIKIVSNGYENITVALPSKLSVEDRTRLITSLKKLFQQSSSLLEDGTKGRAHFRSVVFLVPESWGDIDSWISEHESTTTFEGAGASIHKGNADIVVTDETIEGYFYTLQQAGCGRRGLRIYIPSSSLISGMPELKGETFVHLWSEYRYGIFLEEGFEDDEKFSLLYNIPGDPKSRMTGCNLEYFRSPRHCNDEGTCQEVQVPLVNNGPEFQPRKGIFCEGHLTLSGRNHNPESPSKHNLLCNEEGTLFTVLRNPDFKHGTNAALKDSSETDVSFRFVKEVVSPKVLLAIEISSFMRQEDRYALVKNAISHFLLWELPDGSELSLLVYGGGSSTFLITSLLTLDDIEARISYLEGQPFPDEPSDEADVCIDCVLEEIVDLVKQENSSFTSAPVVVLVTTQPRLSRYEKILEILEESEIRLHTLSFLHDDKTGQYKQSSLYKLCMETGNYFVSLEGDILGNLYGALSDVIREPNFSVKIAQDYLITLDEEVIHQYFILDNSLSTNLVISLTGSLFNPSPLGYEATFLTTPNGDKLIPRKMELVPSWVFSISNPQVGKYTLKTWRKEDGTSPVMLTVRASATEAAITAQVWVEIPEFKVAPSPVQIFAEVKQGINPVINATVIAYIHHPGTDGVSRIPLIDDGLGSVDITKGDGIYSHFFTNFTSKGFYNVFIEVKGGFDEYSDILKGPSYVCCGSSYSFHDRNSTGEFEREAGPATFEITELYDNDIYPPAMVTDLGITKSYNQLVVLSWTAVGDDFDTGTAAYYEMKIFSDRFALRNRFSDSGLELFSDKINTTSLATYGTTLYHQVTLPKAHQRGVYYLAVRAVDEAGNAGEPSNAVTVWLKEKPNTIVCSDERVDFVAMELISDNGADSTHIVPVFIIILFAFLFC